MFTTTAFSQNDTIVSQINGTVINSETRFPMNNVHIINATRVKGTVTDNNGYFEIYAATNDTLLFSYLGFETIKVVKPAQVAGRGNGHGRIWSA